MEHMFTHDEFLMDEETEELTDPFMAEDEDDPKDDDEEEEVVPPAVEEEEEL